MKNKIKVSDIKGLNFSIIGIRGEKPKIYLMEKSARKNCFHKCGGHGYFGFDDQGYILPCRCRGQVIIVEKIIESKKGSKVILGKELQGPSRKRMNSSEKEK